MPRNLIFLFLISCSKVVDIETFDYLPFKKYQSWTYLDENNNEFNISAIKSDSFFIILSFEGNLEFLQNTGDFILIKRTIEYSNYDQLIVAYDGNLPYFPYPFVNGFNKEYVISGKDYFAKTIISIQKEKLNYNLNYYYYEQTPNSKKIIRRFYKFAPDSFIVYAEIGPDTSIIGSYLSVYNKKVLRILRIE